LHMRELGTRVYLGAAKAEAQPWESQSGL